MSRTGFAHERVFRVPTHAEGEYAGAANAEYCFTKDGKVLKEDQPERGHRLDGLVAARRIRDEEGGGVLVSVPDGGVLVVDHKIIVPHPSGAKPNVPVQS